MIGAILGRFGHPVFIVLIGVVLNAAIWAGLWYGGKWAGYSEGVADQVMRQLEADAVGSDAIRERVRDALDEVGIDSTDDDVTAILRRLGGQ